MGSNKLDAMHDDAAASMGQGGLWRQRFVGIVLGGLAGTAAAFSPDIWNLLWDGGVTTPGERAATAETAGTTVIPPVDAAESARQVAHGLMMRARELIVHGKIREAERYLAAAEQLTPDSAALTETRRLLDIARAKIELATKAPASGPPVERADAEPRTSSGPAKSADSAVSSAAPLAAGFAAGVKEFRDRNYDAALAAFGKAAAAGYAPAQNYLGYMYRHGLGVTQDFARALAWYQKAAAQNHAGALNNIGYLHRHGLGVERDYAEARNWFERAAERGDAAGQYNLGQMLAGGIGAAPDYREAMQWFKAAADQGHPRAAMELAHLYAQGLGVTADPAEAYFWYGVAVRSGVEGAQRYRTTLGAQLSSAQRQAADRRLVMWGQQSADREKQ
jgi:TPR repeat protein